MSAAKFADTSEDIFAKTFYDVFDTFAVSMRPYLVPTEPHYIPESCDILKVKKS